MMGQHDVMGLIDGILPKVKALRRKIHENPELAFDEWQTARRVRGVLEGTQIKFREPLLGTDVVGLLDGTDSGANVTLRADMDALPMQEKSDLPYKSKKDGVMHAGVVDLAKQIIDESKWVDLPSPLLIAEDFAYYIKNYPGALFFLGMGEKSAGLHNAYYNFNDEAMKNGISFFVSMVMAKLSNSRLS